MLLVTGFITAANIVMAAEAAGITTIYNAVRETILTAILRC